MFSEFWCVVNWTISIDIDDTAEYFANISQKKYQVKWNIKKRYKNQTMTRMTTPLKLSPRMATKGGKLYHIKIELKK